MKMPRDEFEAYDREFSSAADKSALFDRYYAPDAEFVHPFKGTFRGKEEIVGFWNAGKNSGHAGIHEILHLKNVLSVDGALAAEFDIEWRCFEDTDYLGARHAGDVFWGKCAAFYEIPEDKITHVQVYLNLVDGSDGDGVS